MEHLNEEEIEPGLVLHLDTDGLARSGNCQTTAKPAHIVEGPHYFLIVDVRCGIAHSVPIYSKGGKGRVALDEELKSGEPRCWSGLTSYYFPGQHWLIPVSLVCAASKSDHTTKLSRRRYAHSAPLELERVRDSLHKLPFAVIYKGAVGQMDHRAKNESLFRLTRRSQRPMKVTAPPLFARNAQARRGVYRRCSFSSQLRQTATGRSQCRWQ